MENENDLPKSIIVVLVVLAVAISVLSTITVVTEINRLNKAPIYQGSPSQTGKISLQVIDPPKVPVATGQVMFELIDASEVS